MIKNQTQNVLIQSSLLFPNQQQHNIVLFIWAYKKPKGTLKVANKNW